MKVPINNLRKINDTVLKMPLKSQYYANHFTRNTEKKTINLPILSSNTPN